MTAQLLHTVVDEGLGNTAYLLDLGDGSALAVDASRDLRGIDAAAEKAGLGVRFAADTHLHADFVTGATELARRDHAQVLASAAGNRGYPHTGLGDGDEVDLGGLTLRALLTPGHTDEHVAYLQHFIDLGFGEIYVHNVGREQEDFIRVYGERVIPNLRWP